MRQSNFSDRVYAIVRTIPAGQVLTYGEVAQQAGSPQAARGVGTLMKHNSRSFMTHPDDPTAIPCHRVVASNHKLGGYNGGIDAKQRLLEREGWMLERGRLARPQPTLATSY